MTTLSSEAERLADWLQAAVQTYPQMSEDEPGGYCSELDQMIDQAAALLRRIPELEAELQEQARINGMGAERELSLVAQVSRLEAERDQLRAALATPAQAQQAGEVVAWIWQHDETGRCGFVDVDQIKMGWQTANPRLQLIRPLTYADTPPAPAQPVQAVPDGWKLVRVEPTLEMLRAGHESISCVGSCGEASPPEVSDFSDVWSAMLTSSPTPPHADQKGQ